MLKIHFLNVGHGDCTIIEHASGRITVIDINNSAELDLESSEELAKAYRLPVSNALEKIRRDRGFYIRVLGATQARQTITAYERQTLDELLRKGYDIKLTNPVEFLTSHYPSREIFRYIQSHPDLDHMRGLCALRDENVHMLNFWDTEHNKAVEFQSQSDIDEWAEYDRLRSGEAGAKVLHLYRSSRGAYYNEDTEGTGEGDGIEILSPTPDILEAANEIENTNNLSYVLRLTYKGWKIILGGDAEEDVWEDLVSYYGTDLKCHILKASHHGRDSGYHQKAVELMNPQYTIVSIGQKPGTDASNKYRQYSENVWSTRWKGNITLTIDDNGKAVIDSEYNR